MTSLLSPCSSWKYREALCFKKTHSSSVVKLPTNTRTAMGTKMAVAFANIFMGKVETELLNRSAFKPLVWKRYIDNIFSLWDISREELQQFIEQANNYNPTIKFTAEISETEITFLDTVVYKGNRFITESVLDVRTHYKATETFQYTHFSSCHPPGVKRRFIKGEALRLLQTNSTKATFEEKIKHFESRLIERGYPKNLVQRTLSEVIFENRKQTLQQKPRLEPRTNKRILPFVTQYHPSDILDIGYLSFHIQRALILVHFFADLCKTAT